MNGNSDIVNQLVGEMGLSNTQLDQLQRDQNNINPDALMQQIAHQQPSAMMQSPQMLPPQQSQPQQQSLPRQPDYDDDSEDETEQSEMDLEKLGLDGNSKNLTDRIFRTLRDPIFVFAIIVLLNIVPVENALRRTLPAALKYGIYFIIIKAVLGGALFLGTRFVL